MGDQKYMGYIMGSLVAYKYGGTGRKSKFLEIKLNTIKLDCKLALQNSKARPPQISSRKFSSLPEISGGYACMLQDYLDGEYIRSNFFS